MTFKQILAAILILGFQSEGSGGQEANGEGQSCDGTRLHSAVQNSDMSYIRSLPKNSCELYSKDGQGLTPMHAAILAGDVDAILALAEAQFDVNWIIDEETVPVLFFSVTNGTTETTKTMLDVGSAATTVDYDGKTALYYALKVHKQDIAELLISRGANVNKKDDYMNTYYHTFVQLCDLKALMILSSLKADPEGENLDGETPLSLAVGSDAPALINFLISHGANITQQPHLRKAISSGKLESLRALLENGHPPDSFTDGSDDIPMEVAIEHDLPDAMEILASFGAKLVNSNGDSLLNQSVADDSPKATVWLMDKGVELQKDEEGNNLLHVAVKLKKLKSIKALLSRPRKLDANEKNDDGATPLNLATATSDCSYAAVVKELLENGADVEEMGGQYCPPLVTATHRNCTETVEVILAHGADINKRCTNGNSALIFAIDQENYPLVEKLLILAANPNMKGQREGYTALHWAAAGGNDKIVKELLHYGASNNILNKKGQKPSDVAVAHGHQVTAQLLKNWL